MANAQQQAEEAEAEGAEEEEEGAEAALAKLEKQELEEEQQKAAQITERREQRRGLLSLAREFEEAVGEGDYSSASMKLFMVQSYDSDGDVGWWKERFVGQQVERGGGASSLAAKFSAWAGGSESSASGLKVTNASLARSPTWKAP